ncbi:Lrp/AsnC family transcriptional regulator [Psychromonas sp. Urea-02u-13]|uniref:Lrp/AsnC family transcriptional regulator n=1 Tax=Psychromonas sp. Urea-02u-13 TaxID=2058326 RepID=UPI000C328AF5|nr:Lrp/AsnC family transcriptional regulator [Psychromonas sp. Urea-02u-13]PKG39689.1 AsnC family transcriptional regulator [Psychromonas sp. Urea-02u-13]
MDRFDERILRELKIDGRLSNVQLADRIGLSASATLRRVQELEKSKVIAGYRAVLNPAACGVEFVAYVSIGLSDHSKASQLHFEEAVSVAKEVVECHNITGSSEYLLRVETKSLSAYKQFHINVIGSIPQVNTVATSVVMDSPKDERA